MPTTTTGREYMVVCVHSTRRTRRVADGHAAENRCYCCQATILVHELTVAHAKTERLKLYLVCPRCAAEVAPDAPVDYIIPGTAELLEAAHTAENLGAGGAAFIDEALKLTIGELAEGAMANE